MASSRRPIDPPDLPAWRRTRAGEEDETPTLTGLEGADPFDSEETQWEAVPPSDSVAARWASVSPAGFMTETDPAAKVAGGPVPGLSGRSADDTLSDPGAPPRLTPQPLGQPKEDPRALAQRLAAEAKARLTQGTEPEPEDPRALAKRLAAEAKARTARTPAPAPQRNAALAPPPEPEAEDPRELAKRLAAEAKARAAAAAPAPEPPAEDPRQLAMRLTAEAKARRTPGPSPEASAPPKGGVRKPTLAERAGSKPRSALEILQAAMQEEAAGPEVEPAQPVPEASPEPPPPQATPAPAPVAVAPPSPGHGHSAAAVLLDMLPGAAVEAPIPVERADVFQAVWRAHRTRALHEQDWATVATASVLVDAASRLPAGAFVAARVTLAGQPFAVFADIERRVILGVLSPADVYLAGLGA